MFLAFLLFGVCNGLLVCGLFIQKHCLLCCLNLLFVVRMFALIVEYCRFIAITYLLGVAWGECWRLCFVMFVT